MSHLRQQKATIVLPRRDGNDPKDVTLLMDNCDEVYIPPRQKHYKYDYLLEEISNAGKKYKDYLKEARQREEWYRLFAPTTARKEKEI